MTSQLLGQISKKIETGEALDLIALVNTLDSGSLHTLFTEIVAKASKEKADIQAAFYSRQAKDVRKQLASKTQKTDLLDALCNKLAVLQTGSMLSKYCSGKTFHLNSSYQADVAMLGDSLTEWAHWHELMPDIKVINRGISGDITQGMLQRLDGVINAKPKQVFFMAGVNDLNLGFEFDGVVSRYIEIVETLQSQGIEVMVQSTLLVGERLNDLNPLITKFNHTLAQWCSDNGTTYIDINQVLSQDGLLMQQYTFDDLHLNGSAYQQWSQLIAKFIA